MIAESSVGTSEGFGLHTSTSGSSDAASVVLGLHGGPGSGGDYVRPLHRLAGPSRRVVTFDQLGTGTSDVPPADYRWTLAGAVADVDSVRDSTGADRVSLIGHSYGGMLALQYALDHPDRVERLVLSSTIASTPRMTAGFIRQLVEVLPVEVAAAAIDADARGDHGDPDFVAAVDVWMRSFSTAGDADAAAEQSTEALEPGPAGLGLWGPRLWFSDGAVRDWNVEDRLGEIACPTLVINSGHEMSANEANAVMADGIAGSEWVTLQHNGHTPFEEPNAAVYLAIVSAFLDGWPVPSNGGPA